VADDVGVTDAAAYLARIGARVPETPDLPSLRELMRAHLATVPFENLSIHLGEDIRLTDDALLRKIVDRRRGGFCYELNGAFAWLLRDLGYRVTMLGARVYGGGRLGPPYDHMTLVVGLDEPWLVDVGFGRFLAAPVRFGVAEPQQDPAGTVTFEEVPGPDGYVDLAVLLDGERQFLVDRRPRELAEFAATCWYHQSSPDSHFTQSLVCSLPTDTGRITLSDRTLATTDGAERREEHLADDAAVLAAYRELFGIELDRPPTAPIQR
jgi:N-hydroxyarylamine O-acetyltransferase